MNLKQENDNIQTNAVSSSEKTTLNDLNNEDVIIEDESAEKLDNNYQTEIEVLKTKVTDFENLAKRIQADFDNYRKRMSKERQMYDKLIYEKIFKDFIPVLDSFEKALSSTDESIRKTSFYEGFLLIAKQLKQLLNRYNVVAIDSLNQEFDPNIHEALHVVESSLDFLYKHDTVVEEWQKAYQINDKVIRHAKVVIAKANAMNMQLDKQPDNDIQIENMDKFSNLSDKKSDN